jgi:hypothetical protein
VPKSGSFIFKVIVARGNVRIRRCRASPLIELSPAIQAIEVEKCVEHEAIAPDRFAAVDRIVGEENDVSLGQWNVYDHRPLRMYA